MSQTPLQTFLERIPQAFEHGDPQARDKSLEGNHVHQLQRFYHALVEGNLPEALSLTTEDVVLEILGTSGLPFVGRWQGRQAVEQALRQNFSQVTQQQPEVLSLTAQGDTVLVTAQEQGRFVPTGREYDIFWIQQYEFRDARLAVIREWFDTLAMQQAATPI